jgi:NAD(P)-dependent dehydrogenase (short-subunit alcohol dehydrogenase family)
VTADPPSSRAVLITGCSSGIGAATARRLAARGWDVWATARRPEGLDELCAAGCRTLALDVTDTASMAAAVAAVEAEHGAVGVLVNNAGYSQSGAFEAVPMERVRAQFETNVFGLVELTRLVLPGMRRQRAGRIVNVSSMGGRLVFPGGAFYHATKHAVEALSDALRFEVRGYGIHVVVIEPGLIRSGFGDAAAAAIETRPEVGAEYDEFNAAVAKATRESYERGPLARLAGSPDDVARAIDRALAARRPTPRIKVGASARLLLAQRRWSSDRVWDWFLRRSFPSPGAD